MFDVCYRLQDSLEFINQDSNTLKPDHSTIMNGLLGNIGNYKQISFPFISNSSAYQCYRYQLWGKQCPKNMQWTSEKCGYLQELSWMKNSPKKNLSCFKQNQDNIVGTFY